LWYSYAEGYKIRVLPSEAGPRQKHKTLPEKMTYKAKEMAGNVAQMMSTCLAREALSSNPRTTKINK
jgi:hypothetical protein